MVTPFKIEEIEDLIAQAFEWSKEHDFAISVPVQLLELVRLAKTVDNQEKEIHILKTILRGVT